MSLTGKAAADKLLRGTISKLDVIHTDTYEIAVRNGYKGTVGEWLESLKGKDGVVGKDGEPGASGVYIGKGEPPETANVWVNPDGDPTSTEDWEFDLDSGATDTKTVVVLNSDEATANGRLGILRVRNADGSWSDIPALVGKQGIQGEKGEPGKDGYTPVKGVDYFDGAKGEQGEQGETGATGEKGEKGDKGDKGDTGIAGKDGVSASHSWNGTTLTITSASGTSSADLKGDKGDKGDRGEPGTGVTILGSCDTEDALKAEHPSGNAGDAYLVGGYLYVWSGSAWENVGQIQGPAGADGAKGDKGDTGDQGTQGEKGDKGADGVSVTHSWNGTVLSVTSASGTSSADLKGPKGDTGATGPAYSLTDADKNTIAAAVKASLTTETMTYTYEDGSTRTVEVYVK